MAKMITPNFSVNEIACKCGCGRHEMDGEFMRMLQTLRDEMQGPLKVSSGFRCEDHNQMVSTTGRNGPHTLAKASTIDGNCGFARTRSLDGTDRPHD